MSRITIKNIAKRIGVLQEVDNTKISPKKGRGYSTAMRLNPYNPLSYLVVVLSIPFIILTIGVVGLFEGKNPFKWD